MSRRSAKTSRAIDIAELHKQIGNGDLPATAPVVRMGVGKFLSIADDQVAVGSRVRRFVFSDDSVDRYGDTINAKGWTFNKSRGTVALFGHKTDDIKNVIGRSQDEAIVGNEFHGGIRFATAEENPNAEILLRMVDGGFIDTVSVGFQPIKWQQTKDKTRPGGIDFIEQELLEISIVPVPANKNAIQLARAAGIDVDRLGLTEPPEVAAPAIKIKSLWHIAWLADILMDLDILEDCVEWETAMEEDGSPIASQLTATLQALGQILIDMTVEEVNELLASDDDDDAVEFTVTADPVEMAIRPARMKLLKALAKASPERVRAVNMALAVRDATATSLVDLIASKVQKAGKVLSSANEKTLRDAHDMMTRGCDMVRGVFEQTQPADDDNQNDDGDANKAARLRKAKAMKRKLLAHVSAA